jgi:release factor glutamine methyltransferase
VSNPPYVPQPAAKVLSPDVVNYEPATALFGGSDGLAVIDRLFTRAPVLLAPGASFIVEFGYGQEDSVRAAAEREGWTVRRVLHDLQGIARTVVLGRSRG